MHEGPQGKATEKRKIRNRAQFLGQVQRRYSQDCAAEKGETEVMTSEKLPIFRALRCFLVGGFLMHVVIVTIFLLAYPVWKDFFHPNWESIENTSKNALQLIVMSPIHALTFAFYVSELPIIVATAFAVAAHKIWGHIPFWTLAVLIPICVYAHHIQINYYALATSPTVQPPLLDSWRFAKLAVIQTPILIGCWWCFSFSRRPSSAAAPS